VPDPAADMNDLPAPAAPAEPVPRTTRPRARGVPAPDGCGLAEPLPRSTVRFVAIPFPAPRADRQHVRGLRMSAELVAWTRALPLPGAVISRPGAGN